MLDRAVSSLIAAAAACAATALAIFAAGFGLFALVEPMIGAAGAAGVVSLAAALIVAIYGLVVVLNRRARARESERAQMALQNAIASQLGAFAGDRPLLVTGATLIGGFFAARNPTIARDLLSLFAAIASERRPPE